MEASSYSNPFFGMSVGAYLKAQHCIDTLSRSEPVFSSVLFGRFELWFLSAEEIGASLEIPRHSRDH